MPSADDDPTTDDPTPDDEAAPDDGPMAGTDAGEAAPSLHPAVFASNWRTVLAVDAAMGVAVAVAGIVVAAAWNLVAGGVLGSLGVAYVAAVVRRGRQWAELRRQAGL